MISAATLEVRVCPRNLRWELSVGGVTRPMEDWFFSRERAVAYALQRASELEARAVVVERSDHTVDEVIALDAREHMPV